MKMAQQYILALLGSVGAATSSQIQEMLNYKNKRIIQDHLSYLKNKKLVRNVRHMSLHYWVLADHAQTKAYMTAQDKTDMAELADAIYELVNTGKVARCSQEDRSAYITLQDEDQQWDYNLVISVKDAKEDVTLVISGETQEEVWVSTHLLSEEENIYVGVSKEVIKEHGAFSAVWACNQVSNEYISPFQLQPIRQGAREACIGTKEWKNAVIQGQQYG